MRKRRVWGVAATLALALAAPAARADGPATRSPGLLGRMFAGPAKPEGPKAGPADEDARQEAVAARARSERQKIEAEKAFDDYVRRQKVIDRLVEIALQTNDPALEKKARALEERAWAVYRKKGPRRGDVPAGLAPDEDRPPSPRSAPRREEP